MAYGRTEFLSVCLLTVRLQLVLKIDKFAFGLDTWSNVCMCAFVCVCVCSLSSTYALSMLPETIKMSSTDDGNRPYA